MRSVIHAFQRHIFTLVFLAAGALVAVGASAADKRIIVTPDADYPGFDMSTIKDVTQSACEQACLDDNTAVEFASGDMPAAASTQVESHLATCRDCRTLVAALAPAPGDPDSDLATPARPPRGKHRSRDIGLASTDAGSSRRTAA